MLDLFFFFNDTATTEIYTLSLHDALPISNEPGITRDRIYGKAEWRGRALEVVRSEEHTSELQSRLHLVCRLLLGKKNNVHPSSARRTFPPGCTHVLRMSAGQGPCASRAYA